MTEPRRALEAGSRDEMPVVADLTSEIRYDSSNLLRRFRMPYQFKQLWKRARPGGMSSHTVKIVPSGGAGADLRRLVVRLRQRLRLRLSGRPDPEVVRAGCETLAQLR